MGMIIGNRVALAVAVCVAGAWGDDTKCMSLMQARPAKLLERAGGPPGAGGGATPDGGCAGSLVMVDSRPLEPVASLEPGSGAYWAKAAAINHAYCRRHGYRFTYVHLDVPRELMWTANSLKPYVLRQLVEQHVARAAPPGATAPTAARASGAWCAWGMLLDSDAVVRDPQVPLGDLLENVSLQLGGPGELARAVAVVELESGFSPAKLNTGVALFDYDRVHGFLNAWVQEQLRPENLPLRIDWPGEQGVLEQMLARSSSDIQRLGIHSVPSIEEKVGVVEQRTMNQPDGWFVRHFWGSPEGHELRGTEFDTVLSALNLGQTADFNSALEEITGNAPQAYMNMTLPGEVLSMLMQQASSIE